MRHFITCLVYFYYLSGRIEFSAVKVIYKKVWDSYYLVKKTVSCDFLGNKS